MLFAFGLFVRTKGLEPPRLSAPDPKSGAATNYATSAVLFSRQRYKVFVIQNIRIHKHKTEYFLRSA